MKRSTVALLMALVCISTRPALAATSTLEVDVATCTNTPENPRVNTGATPAGEALAIRVKNAGQPVPADQIQVTVVGLPSAPSNEMGLTYSSYSKALPESTNSGRVAPGLPFIQFEPCTRKRREDQELKCPSLKLREDGTFLAYMDIGSLLVTVEDTSTGKTCSVPLEVLHREAAFSFSGGFGGFDVRDERFRLVSVKGEDENLKIERVSDGSPKRSIVALANYMGFLGRDWLGVSVGIGVNESMDSFSAFAGPTVALLTFEEQNTLYLTVGWGYTRKKELVPDFEDGQTVPAATNVASLTQDVDADGLAVMLSFRFAGNGNAFNFLSGSGEEEEE